MNQNGAPSGSSSRECGFKSIKSIVHRLVDRQPRTAWECESAR
jgi:hypothetical protein